jgi:hypothetical protein
VALPRERDRRGSAHSAQSPARDPPRVPQAGEVRSERTLTRARLPPDNGTESCRARQVARRRSLSRGGPAPLSTLRSPRSLRRSLRSSRSESGLARCLKQARQDEKGGTRLGDEPKHPRAPRSRRPFGSTRGRPPSLMLRLDVCLNSHAVAGAPRIQSGHAANARKAPGRAEPLRCEPGAMRAALPCLGMGSWQGPHVDARRYRPAPMVMSGAAEEWPVSAMEKRIRRKLNVRFEIKSRSSIQYHRPL